MNHGLSHTTISAKNRGQEIECLAMNRRREEALERLIAALEIAVFQFGRVYRPATRISSNRLNQSARLSAAHAAYVLASRPLMQHTGKAMMDEVAIQPSIHQCQVRDNGCSHANN